MTSVAEWTRAWANDRKFPHVFTEETGSTNQDAKQTSLYNDAAECLFVTAHQTHGRGRGTNQWLDTGGGESLLSTWSFALPAAPQAITGPRIGLALHRAAAHAWPSLDFGLKAPNDLFLAGLKIAGLLIETIGVAGQYRLLVGLGFNVGNHPRRFHTATHLSGALGRAGDDGEWYQFLDEWLKQLRECRGEILNPTLDPRARVDLRVALNANAARAYNVTDVSPEGDLRHAGGVVRWTDL